MEGMNSDEIRDYKEELEKQAQLMDKINLKLAKIYANSTGLELSTIQDMMKAETWLTAEEAKEYNFIGSIEGALAIAAYASPKELAKKGYKVPSNYVNQLNNVNMSEKEGLLDQLKAYVSELLAPKAEAVEEEAVEETVEESVEEVEEVEEEVTEEPQDAVDVESIKAELMDSIKAELTAKDSELAELKKELDKAKASRKPLEAKEDVVNPEAKTEVVDELGAAILNILKSSYK
tara:strand:- start:162 stop:863 length:702 start_codon:yes stop_codon:yes gene_type:complete